MPNHLKDLTAGGATAAIGSVEDDAFPTKTFTGANASIHNGTSNYGAPDPQSLYYQDR